VRVLASWASTRAGKLKFVLTALGAMRVCLVDGGYVPFALWSRLDGGCACEALGVLCWESIFHLDTSALVAIHKS
jgi:hypothetical protein